MIEELTQLVWQALQVFDQSRQALCPTAAAGERGAPREEKAYAGRLLFRHHFRGGSEADEHQSTNGAWLFFRRTWPPQSSNSRCPRTRLGRDSSGPGWRPLWRGEKATDGFYGNLLDHITACPGRQLEVKLKGLPHTWRFRLEGPSEKKKQTGC